MRQELQTLQPAWRSEAGGRRWLAALIAAMEEASQPERRRQAVPAETEARFRMQLALPASFRSGTSVLRH
jgi:hypothetical protein